MCSVRRTLVGFHQQIIKKVRFTESSRRTRKSIEMPVLHVSACVCMHLRQHSHEHLVTGRDAGEMRFGMIEVTMPASGVAIAALSPPPPTAACIVRVEAPGSSVDKLTYRFVPASELGRIAVDLPGASHTQSRGAAAPRQLRRKRDILATLLQRVVGRDGGVQGEPGRQRKRDMVRELWGRIRSS